MTFRAGNLKLVAEPLCVQDSVVGLDNGDVIEVGDGVKEAGVALGVDVDIEPEVG